MKCPLCDWPVADEKDLEEHKPRCCPRAQEKLGRYRGALWAIAAGSIDTWAAEIARKALNETP